LLLTLELNPLRHAHPHPRQVSSPTLDRSAFARRLHALVSDAASGAKPGKEAAAASTSTPTSAAMMECTDATCGEAYAALEAAATGLNYTFRGVSAEEAAVGAMLSPGRSGRLALLDEALTTSAVATHKGAA
jgi:hypothetical protein